MTFCWPDCLRPCTCMPLASPQSKCMCATVSQVWHSLCRMTTHQRPAGPACPQALLAPATCGQGAKEGSTVEHWCSNKTAWYRKTLRTGPCQAELNSNAVDSLQGRSTLILASAPNAAAAHRGLVITTVDAVALISTWRDRLKSATCAEAQRDEVVEQMWCICGRPAHAAAVRPPHISPPSACKLACGHIALPSHSIGCPPADLRS